MSLPFESLREKLLIAGIAPRYVRRYVAELDDHLADLVVANREKGFADEESAARARVMLGDDVVLIEAMTSQPRFRALSARAPWLVFGLAPPVFIILMYFAAATVVICLVHQSGHAPMPMLERPVGETSVRLFVTSANYLIGVLTALGLSVVAMRQRMNSKWLFIGLAQALLFGDFLTLSVVLPQATATTGEISLSSGLLPHPPSDAPQLSLWHGGLRAILTLTAAFLTYLWFRLIFRRKKWCHV